MHAELSLAPAAIDALADDIADTAAHIDAATHRLLVLIREFDLGRGWDHQGALSCAHWLSWRIGLGLGPAREKVRVAHRLADLPLLDEAFRRGELSYSKLRAMTRVATPATEAQLLDLARHSTAAQLERICRFYRQARSQAGEDPRTVEDERRWVVSRPTEDGMVSIQIRLLPDEAAAVMRALEVCAERGSLADGAVALAETALAGSRRQQSPAGTPSTGVGALGQTPSTRVGASGAGGSADIDVLDIDAPVGEGAALDDFAGDVSICAAAATTEMTLPPLRQPVEVVIHIAAARLEGSTDAGDGLSAETCRRLLCDAGVVPILEDASGRAIDVGRKTRKISPALRRALHARDRTCRFPGCTYRRSLDAHHVVHWIDGGETKLSNVFHTCRRHHRYLHEYGFSAIMRDGELVFLDPNRREIPAVFDRRPLPDSAFDRLRAGIERNGIHISAVSNAPGWDGEPVDYDACVGSIGGFDQA